MRAYHFISEKYALNVVSDQRLKVSLLNDLNDPFELNAVDLPDRESRKKAKAFKDSMAEHYGILCFSKTWGSPLLWSHYANRHKGVALEFKLLDSIAHPIKYRRNRYDLNSGKSYNVAKQYDKKDIEGIWLTKYDQWEYEKEVRVIVKKTECHKEKGKYFYNFGPDIQIKGIIFGPLCNITIDQVKKSLPPKVKLSVIKSRLAFRSFDIVIQGKFNKKHLMGQIK